MSFKESITKTTTLGYFEGAIPVNYQYTFGMAGDRFFSEVRDKGDFLASKCPDCGALYVYPQIYCDDCFSETSEFVSIGTEGLLYSATKSYRNNHGEHHKKPQMIGMVRFDGVRGGIIHRLNIEPSEICLGMKVKAKFKPQKDRQGSIDDILYFEKA